MLKRGGRNQFELTDFVLPRVYYTYILIAHLNFVNANGSGAEMIFSQNLFRRP